MYYYTKLAHHCCCYDAGNVNTAQSTVNNTASGLPSFPFVIAQLGRDGRDGMPGRDGRDGPQGRSGEKGDTGAQGPPGIQGNAAKVISNAICEKCTLNANLIICEIKFSREKLLILHTNPLDLECYRSSRPSCCSWSGVHKVGENCMP